MTNFSSSSMTAEVTWLHTILPFLCAPIIFCKDVLGKLFLGEVK